MSVRGRYFLPPVDGDTAPFQTEDPGEFTAECKRRGMRSKASVRPRVPRVVTRTSKPFDPAVGQVGSWVTGKVSATGERVTGQVWSLVNNWHGSVWVVTDDQRAHMCRVDLLEPLHVPAVQGDLLSSAIESGRLQIVAVSW
jgi:hypothetical protein